MTEEIKKTESDSQERNARADRCIARLEQVLAEESCKIIQTTHIVGNHISHTIIIDPQPLSDKAE